jgi:hypothetical protein
MSDYSPINLSVKSARLLDEDATLKHAKLVEDMLAPPVQLPKPAPMPVEEDPGFEQAPESMDPGPARRPLPPPRSAPPRDYEGDLAEASNRSNDNRFIANTTSAADHMISTAAGTKGSDFGKQLGQQADQPLDEFKMSVDLDKFNNARQKELDLDDPMSRTSAVAREQYRQLDPQRASQYGAAFEEMTARDLEKQFGISLKDMQIDMLMEKARAADAAKTADRGQKQAQFEAVQPRENLKAETGVVGATAALLNARKMNDGTAVSGAQAAVGNRRVGDRIIDYAKKTEKLGEALVALDQVERLQPGMTKGAMPEGASTDVDWTKIKNAALRKGLGQQFTEPQAQALRSSIMMFKGKIRHMLAGAQLTDYEANYYDQAFADSLLSPPAVQAAVLDMFRHTLHGSIARSESAYRNTIENEQPGRWQQYTQEPGAVTTSHALFSDLRESMPAGAPGQKAARPAPGPSPPISTAKSVVEPSTVTVRLKGTNRKKQIPADKVGIFLNNPLYEILNGN